MQILIFDEAKASFVVGIVGGIYNTVARVYDVLISLSKSSAGSLTDFSFSSLANVFYVLAGIFMLFRVTIALIEMLINPDRVSDSQTGAGKLLTRVMTSIVLLMLLAPEGLVFKNFVPTLENAVIQDLIPRLMDNVGTNSDNDNSSTSDTASNTKKDSNTPENASYAFAKFFYDDVYADTDHLTCYYVRVDVHQKAPDVTRSDNSKITWAGMFKIDFYNDNTHTNKIGDKYSYESESGTEICNWSGCPKELSGKEIPLTAYGWKIKIPNNDQIAKGAVFGDGFPTSCPKHINDTVPYNTPTTGIDNVAYATYPDGDKIKNCNIVKWHAEDYGDLTNDACANIGTLGGYNSLSGIIQEMYEAKEDTDVNTDVQEGNKTAEIEEEIKSSAEFDGLLPDLENDEAAAFSKNIMGTFVQCSGDDGVATSDECSNAKEQMLTESNNGLIELMGDGRVTLDWFGAMITGALVVVYLVFLCVEVVVRKFKLLLLQMVAPIPIISYSDPKDKMLGQWSKMYISTYIDIFLKLFGIQLGTAFIPKLTNSFIHGGERFVSFAHLAYIIGILVFIKLVPTMISKIFGLDSLGGSFKDIKGMGKAALGFGAGAAIGAGTGLVTGIGAFHATKGQGKGNRFLAGAQAAGSTFSGALRGAGSGSKGNALGGAKNIAGVNANRSNLYRSGLRPTDLLVAGTAGRVSMDAASRIDREIQADKDTQESLNRFTGFKGKMEDAANDSKFMKSVMQARANGFNIGQDKVEKLRNEWINAQLSGESGQDFINRMTDASVMGADASLYSNLFNDARFGFDMQSSFTEGGKKAVLESTLRQANSELRNNANIKGIADAENITSLTSYNDIDKVNKKAKEQVTSIDDRIYEKTSSPEYLRAQAAKNVSGNKKQ